MQHISAQKMAKNILSSFWHRFGHERHESARAPLCKLACCTLQIFLSKLKLLQTRQTDRKNKKLSKVEIGYYYTLFCRETHKLTRYQRRELSCTTFIHKSKAYKTQLGQLAQEDLTHSQRENLNSCFYPTEKNSPFAIASKYAPKQLLVHKEGSFVEFLKKAKFECK